MKRLFMLLGVSVFILGATLPSLAQVIELPEIEIKATNYKYISAMGNEADISVQQLEDSVADYDVKGAEFYQDEYQTYFVTFFIPEGKVLAAYDGEGELLRTVERFKGVKVPKAVKRAVEKNYPGWTIAKDVYRVTYHNESGKANKRYKLVLENSGKRMRVKVNEKGEFI